MAVLLHFVSEGLIFLFELRDSLQSHRTPTPIMFSKSMASLRRAAILISTGRVTFLTRFVWIVNPMTSMFNYSPCPPSLTFEYRALDLFFKFFSPPCLRIIPALFLRDMCVALSVPSSQERPKTSHYSPMLHNALLSLALSFLDDPELSDPKTRQCYFDKAKSFMDAECQHPNMSVIRALSFLGSFYGAQGKQELGFMYFGENIQTLLKRDVLSLF